MKGLTAHRRLGPESAFLRLNPEIPTTPSEVGKKGHWHQSVSPY